MIWVSNSVVFGSRWIVPPFPELDNPAVEVCQSHAFDFYLQKSRIRISWLFGNLRSFFIVGAIVQGSINKGSGTQLMCTKSHRKFFTLYRLNDGGTNSLYTNRYAFADGWGDSRRIEDMPDNINSAKVALDHSGKGFTVWDQSLDIWFNQFLP